MSAPSARAALDAARRVFAGSGQHTAPEFWQAAQDVLQHTIERPELSGQALIAEVRRLGLITLTDAHALVALSSWADVSTGLAVTESERILVREAWMALEHAVPEVPLWSSGTTGVPSGGVPSGGMPSGGMPPTVTPRAPGPPAGTPPVGSPPGGTPLAGTSSAASYAPGALRAPRDPAVGATAMPSGAGPAKAVVSPDAAIPTPASEWRRRLWWGVAVLMVLAVPLGALGWWFMVGKPERDFRAAVAAYQSGAHDMAQAAFAQLAIDHPEDARPLIYLGRLTREAGDLARARTFLTNAVRLAPESAIAARELGSVMLADGQPEIARRFYVRAVQLDPADRTAQGFLGCALARLGRFEEAERWAQRAGAGDWQRCLPAVPFAPTTQPAPSPSMPSARP